MGDAADNYGPTRCRRHVAKNPEFRITGQLAYGSPAGQSTRASVESMRMSGLVGVWRLVEAFAFDDAGQKVPSPLGPHPMGVAIFDAERMMVMIGDGRTALPPETKRAFAAYSASYTFDGTKAVARVDGASSPEMMEDQIRQIQFDGAERIIVVPVSNLLGRSRGLKLVWERCEPVHKS